MREGLWTRCSETSRDDGRAGDDRTLVVGAPGARGAQREIDRLEPRRPGAGGGSAHEGPVLRLRQASRDQGERARIRRNRQRPKQPKLVAALEAGIPPDVCRGGQGQGALYRAQGHLIEVTDIVDKMQQVPGGLFDASLKAVMHKGKAYGIPQSVSPSPLVTRLDILEAAKVDPPKTWDEFIEVCKRLQKPPKLLGFGMCLGLTTDTEGNVMDVIWGHGGKLVEADDKTVALNSPGTVQAVKLIADMYLKHKIIPKGLDLVE